MAFRRLLRGRVDDDTLQRVAAEVGARYDRPRPDIEPLEADNWLSTPCVVDEALFVKVITDQNALVHALLTAGRNLGVFSSGVEGFFERYDTPLEMAEHELEATRRMRDLGVNAPEPLEAFEFEGLGVLVLEYLPDFRTLEDLDPPTVEAHAPALFDSLRQMHDDGLVHGDLRGENVLVADDTLYFIDATKVREAAIDDGRAYDLACALAALEPLIGAGSTVEVAAETVDDEGLLAAESFLDFVNIRPDHDFDAVAVKSEIEKRVA
ncbi:RIO1 family regulatory kinase/ATPase [Halobacteriales archaeon Cl-PHB]